MRFDRRLRPGPGVAVPGTFLPGRLRLEEHYPVRGKLVYADNEEPVRELAGFEVIFTSEKVGKSGRGDHPSRRTWTGSLTML